MKKLSKWKLVPGDKPIMYVDYQTSRQESSIQDGNINNSNITINLLQR